MGKGIRVSAFLAGCLGFVFALVSGCSLPGTQFPTRSVANRNFILDSVQSKWDLWANGTALRGANIWQKVIDPAQDGDELGTEAVGPYYSQDNLNQLAAMGANYVNVSYPGLYTEGLPYQLNPQVQDCLDRLLARIEQANLFAVISFRTGPGRDEATFDNGKTKANNLVWTSQAAQDELGSDVAVHR